MTTTGETPGIRWRLHLRSAPREVWRMIATDEGRERFWARQSQEEGDRIRLRFSNGEELEVPILERDPPHRFVFGYFGGSRASFTIADDGSGGSELVLEEERPEDHAANLAGWVSVLLQLKAAVDFGVDLRNSEPERSWERGYVDV